ncbi:MAG TPA: hypothetical protein VNA44_01870 [Burkholderiaceae bacterium]|nr:hypothetical protein [Burkholderiaceae bacterium]
MGRVIVVFVSLTLACYPAQAIAPAVLIAKEIVKQIIFDFVEARIEDSIRASFGLCKADLAEDAVKTSRTLTGLLRGSSGAGLSNVSALGNVGNLGNLGAVSGQARTVHNLQNVQSTADSVASAAHLVGAAGGGDAATAIAQVAGTVAGTAGTTAGIAGSASSLTGGVGGVGALSGLGGQAIGNADAMAAMSRMLPSGAGMASMGGADMQQAMAMMQQMMNAKPLEAAEINELATILESFGKISEAIQPGTACSAEDYRRQFMRITATSAQPGLGAQGGAMAGGVLRMMYTSFKDMQRSTAEAEQMFLKMSAEDRVEYVQTTLAEMKDQPPEGRRAFLAMIDAGMFGMPEDMRSAFRKQLAS